ncbi:MAG TPA: sigma-70 family RNA polymerase sigma factor [Solirubrobacteraceae bacterium]
MTSPSSGRGLPPGLARLSDERLARMVAHGSDRAFVTIYERHSQPLYRYCRSIVGNDADAQDALQSACTSALVALRRGARDAPLRPWLFRITHNEAVSLLRRRRPLVELTEGHEPATPSAGDRALERERLTLMVGDLRELGDRQRGALVMRELSGLSHADIAVALGISVGAAKQAIFEARRALLDLAEGRAMSCEQICRMISDGDRRALRARRVRAHLRSCEGCATFAAAIPARRAELQALAPPLAPLAAAGVLGGVLGGYGSGHAGAAGGWLAGGAAGKSAAAALVAKSAIGVVILTTATVGVTRVLQPAKHSRAPISRTAAPVRGGAPASGTTPARRLGTSGTQANGVAAVQAGRAHAHARPLTKAHEQLGRGGAASKERLARAHGGAGSRAGLRPSRRSAAQLRGQRPARKEGQSTTHGKAGSSGSGRDRAAPVLGAHGTPAHPNGASAVETKSSVPILPAPASERLQGPTHTTR